MTAMEPGATRPGQSWKRDWWSERVALEGKTPPPPQEVTP